MKKLKVTFNLKEDTKERLEKFCDASGIWNMSTFADKAVQEKLEREKNK